MGISRSKKGQLAARQAFAERRDFNQTASGADLTPSSILTILREADTGRTRRLVEVVCDLRGSRDLHLMGVEQTRRAAVAGKPWELRPGKKFGKETPPAVMDATKAMLDGAKGFTKLLGQCQDAVPQPLAAFELIWAISEGQAWIEEFDNVHPKRFAWNTTIDEPGLRYGELRLMTEANLARGERLRTDAWMIHQVTTQTDFPWRCGLGRALLWYEGFKSFSWRNWAIWLEVCAMPLRIASVPESMLKEDRALVNSALESLGTDSFATISEAAKITFESSGNNAGDQSYLRMIQVINDEISKAYLGHTGSADSTPGRLGGEGLAGEIRQDLVESDARGIEASINEGPIEAFVRLNFEGEPPPTIHLQVDAQQSRRERMALGKEAWLMGLPVDAEALASATGVRLTNDPKKMLPPPGPQAAAQSVAGATAPQPNAGGVV